jgi:hypothetical protein
MFESIFIKNLESLPGCIAYVIRPLLQGERVFSRAIAGDRSFFHLWRDS